MTVTEQERERDVPTLTIPEARWADLLKVMKPSVYLLHSACWRAGLTVNGIRPETVE